MTSELSSIARSPQTSAVRLRLDALAENLMLVRQAADGVARQFGASEEVVDDLKLAVTEACSNVVKYAYRGEAGELEVCIDSIDEGFVVVVTDSGTWLDRAEDPDDGEGGGLGIALMEAVTSECEIVTDASGTRVRLEFPLVRAAQDPGDD
jgi:serine/threonine-protein kinase RsbW